MTWRKADEGIRSGEAPIFDDIFADPKNLVRFDGGGGTDTIGIRGAEDAGGGPLGFSDFKFVKKFETKVDPIAGDLDEFLSALDDAFFESCIVSDPS